MVATEKPKSQETVKQPPGEVEEDKGQEVLFPCPNVGCIKVHQRQCALENHLCLERLSWTKLQFSTTIN